MNIAVNPHARPLGIYETKMGALNGKRSIQTILRKNRAVLQFSNTQNLSKTPSKRPVNKSELVRYQTLNDETKNLSFKAF